jgi:hypothetical protein
MPRAFFALIIAVAVAVSAAPAHAAKVRQGPKGDDFYDPPQNAKGKHGALIWARRQTGRDALAGLSRRQPRRRGEGGRG